MLRHTDLWTAIAQSVRAGRSGDRKSVEASISASVQTGPEDQHSLLYNGYRVKRRGRGVDNTPLSSAEVKERVELNIYFPSGPL